MRVSLGEAELNHVLDVINVRVSQEHKCFHIVT